MGLWDKLKNAFTESKQEAEKAAATAAIKGAAKGAAAAAEKAADSFVSDAEKLLREEQDARKGRTDVRPDSSEADSIAADIERLVAESKRR